MLTMLIKMVIQLIIKIKQCKKVFLSSVTFTVNSIQNNDFIQCY